MRTKKELRAYLENHLGDKLLLKMYEGENGMVVKTEERELLEVRSRDIITGRLDEESGELIPVYLTFKAIEKVTEDFFEFTTLFDNVVRFYLRGEC